MFSRSLDLVVGAFALCCALRCEAHAARVEQPASNQNELRVCADPENLPYSDRRGNGFENAIAVILAKELGMELHYDWLQQRRGFVRKTIGEGGCDLLMGVPEGFERVSTTHAYYRSTYVFVTRADERVIESFDDPELLTRRVGVQLPGDDLAATPPGYALARVGAIDNVVGYTFYGNAPAAERMLNDLQDKRIDVAVIWGPQVGYFAQRSKTPLVVTPVKAPPESSLPFEFSIAVGVRKTDRALKDRLDAALEKHRVEIDNVLDRFGVPRVDSAESKLADASGVE